jgi:hypothetical protein
VVNKKGLEEADMAYFEVLSTKMPRGTEENHKKYQWPNI